MKGNFTSIGALLCLFFSTFFNAVNAQNTYQADADYILAPLDRSAIPTQTLYDRVFPVAGIENFDGSPNTLVTNSDHFWQAATELYNASFYKNFVQSPDELYDKYGQNYSVYRHPLGLICHRYNMLDSNAVRKNLLASNNGQLSDVSGRTESPYLERTALIATPLNAPEEHFKMGMHELVVDPQFFIGNRVGEIKRIRIDFGDGQGFREVYADNPNARIALTPTAFQFLVKSINQAISILIDYKSGELGQALATLTAKEPPRTPIGGCNGGDNFEVMGLTASLGDYGEADRAGQGTAYIFYSNANCATKRINKPIVFIDGFDPTNSRDVEQIYNGYINKLFPQNGQPVYMAEELRARGYDLIVFDYKKTDGKENRTGGADFIEVNALSVVKLLQEIYTRYASQLQEDIVLIGPSMGSLIGQYALAYMEKNNIPHHTRLFMSFDGPHQGANIPIGVQEFVNRLAQRGIVADLKKSFKNSLHNSRAAKQMLIHHADAQSESPAAHPWRAIFLNHLSAVGTYPNLCRKVAVINGNNHGIINNQVNSCEPLIHIDIQRSGIGSWLCSGINCKKLDWTAYSSASQNRCKSMAMWTRMALVGELIDQQQKLVEKYSQPAPGNFTYDKVPGSYFGDLFDASSQNALSFLTNFLSHVLLGREANIDISKIGKFSFVPSTSAADIRNFVSPNFNLSSTNLTRCSGTTPFDVVYASTESTDHVAIDSRNADSFRNEIYNRYGFSCAGTGDITASPDNYSKSKDGGTTSISTWNSTNGYFITVSDPSWITVSIQSTEVQDKINFNITLLPNPEAQPRTGTVVLNGRNGGSKTITIYQEGTTSNCNLPTNTCYTIRVQKTGQVLQAQADGYVLQQGVNGSNAQIWKAEDAGSGQYRFTAQDGTNRVIKVNDGQNFGEWLTLGSYTGEDRQKWNVQCNPTDNTNWRIYRNNITWDVKDYGSSPQVQLWGNATDAFYDYRSFRFENVGCPSGGSTPPPTGGSFTLLQPVYNCQTGQLTAQTSGGNGTSIEYQISGLRGWSTEATFTVPSWQLQGTNFTIQARQSGNEVSLSYTTSCNGGTPPTGGGNTGGGSSGGQFTITAPTMNCSTGGLTINTTGGNGSSIEYMAIGLQGWGTNNVLNIPSWQRNGTSFTIQARQAGTEATPYTFVTNCGSGRISASSLTEGLGGRLQVAPNPNQGHFKAIFQLKHGEDAALQLVNALGMVIWQKEIRGTGQIQEEIIELEYKSVGVYFVNLRGDSLPQSIKVLLQQ